MSLEKFKTVTLADVSLNNKGEYGIGASAVDFSDDLYTYLRITDINDDGTLNNDELKSVDDEDAKNYLLKENDVVFARTGNSTGKAYYYNKMDGELVYAGFLIKFSLDPKKINPKFIKYYVLSEEYKGWVNSMCPGSTRPNINAKMYGNMEFLLPPREQQDFLVNILDELDKKIEINKKINKNLLTISNKLYEEWFLNFEFPNGFNEPYKTNNGEFKDTDLGAIPLDWEIGTLKDLIDFKNGYSFKSGDLLKNECSECYAIFKMGNIIKGGGFNPSATKSWIKKSEAPNLDKYLIKKGDLLMCMTDMKGNVALLGHTALMDVDNEYLLNQRVGLLRVSNDIGINYPYLYLLTNHHIFLTNLRGRANSGVQVNLSTKEIKDSKIIIPSKNINQKFNNIVKPIFDIIFTNNIEIQKLTKLRDTLLPKLMSGEIDVSKINCDLE